MTPEQQQKFEFVLMIIGACVPILSLIVSILNHAIRTKMDAGKPVSPALAGLASFLNILAVNIDKGVQLARLSQGKPVTSTGTSTTEAPVPVPSGAVAGIKTDTKPPQG